MVITDTAVAAPRSISEIVAWALRAGAPAIQLRAKSATARELFELGIPIRDLTLAAGALFIVNDRIDVALALAADGAHLGEDDLPIRCVRPALPPTFLLGFSADDPKVARNAVALGADYIGCGAVYQSSNKADVGEAIGPDGLARVVEAVDVPVVAIGGITLPRASEVAASGACGCAVIEAVMGAHDPAAAVRSLLGSFQKPVPEVQ